MKVIPGDQPDVWFDPDDLSSTSLIIIRKESVTCCGFLGGDQILIIRSGACFADLLSHYRPVVPYQEREKQAGVQKDLLLKKRDELISTLKSEPFLCDARSAGSMSRWSDLLSQINQTVWFSGKNTPFRYELILQGDIQTFLSGSLYPDRLMTCLTWWYTNEAEPEERQLYSSLRTQKNLSWPADHDLIVRAVNLYNHGTYELTGFFSQ